MYHTFNTRNWKMWVGMCLRDSPEWHCSPKTKPVQSILIPAQALEHPLARPLLPLIPESIRDQFLTSAEVEDLLSDYQSAQHYLEQFASTLQKKFTSTDKLLAEPQADTTCDFENLKQHYSSHFTGSPVTVELWNEWHDETGAMKVSSHHICCAVFCGGVEPNLRSALWPKILGAEEVS